MGALSTRTLHFHASLPLTGVVVRNLASRRVLLTLEVPKSDQEAALIVGALTGYRFQVQVAVEGLADAGALQFSARLPKRGTVARNMGDGATLLTLEAQQEDNAAARAVAALTECALAVTIVVDEEEAPDDDDPAHSPAPRRYAAKRRVPPRDARL